MYTYSVNVGITSQILGKSMFHNPDWHNMHDPGMVKVNPRQNQYTGTTHRGRVAPYAYPPLPGSQDSERGGCDAWGVSHCSDGTPWAVWRWRVFKAHLRRSDPYLWSDLLYYRCLWCLTAERAYKKAITPFDAFTLMHDKMPNHFDKKLFALLLSLYKMQRC